MMISRRSYGIRGSAPMIALSLSLVVFLSLAGMVARHRLRQKTTNKDVRSSYEQMALHSVSALFKHELATNYQAFQTSSSWASCRGTGTLANFLTILKSPGVGTGTDPNGASNATLCPSVSFALTELKTSTGAGSVTLANFTTTELVFPGSTSGLRVSFQPTEFVINTRTLISGTFRTESSANATGTGARELANYKTSRGTFDVARVIAAPSGNLSCRICRATPGSVCCDDVIRLTYLEDGSGRLIEIEFDQSTQSVTLTPTLELPNPTAVAVKNLTGTRTDYSASSFCIPAIQVGPIAYIVDAATQNGTNYYLTTSGIILRDSSPVAMDPRMVSIAYDDTSGTWYLLGSDGSVYKTSNLEDDTSYDLIPGLRIPIAAGLAVGLGPPIVFPCS